MTAIGSSSGHVRACLESIERHNAELGAFITVMADEALQAAEHADGTAARGDWLGVLHGIPVSVKDHFATAGVRTTMGSDFFRHHVPKHDAEIVRRLKVAGAILLAKDNMHEFASGATTQNPHFGPCRNPWDITKIPGGSSGGSAVAVSSGMVVGSVGTDAGGSVRLPAALCGVVALRPTFGRVSRWNDGLPEIDDFAVPGPLARRVTDVARLFVAIEGYDPRDSSSVNRPRDSILGELFEGVAQMRVGMAVGSYLEKVDPDVASAVQEAGQVLRTLGADVTQISLPGVESVESHYGVMRWAQGAAAFESQLKSEPERFGKDVLEALRNGARTTSIDYAKATAWRRSWIRELQEVFGEVDVVISPTSPVTAPELTVPSFWMSPGSSLLRVWSLAGMPSLSVPCGFATNGLPIGMEVAGPPWQERRLLKLGTAYQQTTEWHLRLPPIVG